MRSATFGNEASPIASAQAAINAIVDALRPLGITFMDMPLTPLRVWEYIQAAGNGGDGPPPTEQGASVDEHGRGAAGSGPTSPSEGGGA